MDRLSPAQAREKHRAAFQSFWAAYPRKVAINEAERVFSETVEGTPSRPGVDPVLLIEKARAYARNVDPDRMEYVPSPHKWLRDGHYADNDLFTDQRAAEKDWLRGCYQRCDQAAVENKYHVKMPRPTLPENITDPDEIRQWYKRQVQSWILDVAKKVENG